MKRYLVLCVAALCLPVQAGNLGPADYVMYGVREMKAPLEIKSRYVVHPGRFRTRNKDAAVAEFVDGLLWIKTSPKYLELLKKGQFLPEDFEVAEKGIAPSQILGFDYHASHPVIIFSIVYKDDTGVVNQASWNFKWADKDARSFRHAFLQWLNSGRSSLQEIPSDGTDSSFNP